MSRPIEDYALVGDLHTAALISRGGSVDWLCFPRFDSAACFAALLGAEDNGHWTIAPQSGGDASSRRYRDGTLVLESEWTTPDGAVRVVDFMPPRDDLPDLIRVVEGVSGRVPMRSTVRIRFDYGHIVPWVRQVEGELCAIAGPDALWLRSPVEARGVDKTTVSEFTVAAGDRVAFALTWSASHKPKPRAIDPLKALDQTTEFWRRWISTAKFDGRYADAVSRSLITLKALTYRPTGGIAAAATTSLPEQLGGNRNWDYRYCWLRDATMTLHAMLSSGYHDEAKAWREWLVRAVAGDPKDMQIMYGLDGSRRLVEYELPWLAGYAGSQPVRVGNAASEQLQLDVYGEVMDALELSRAAGLSVDEDAWSFQQIIMDYLEGHWSDPDNGIWEIRGDRQHFTHSKVMCWVAVDRAIRGVEQWGLAGPIDRWKATRDAIRSDVLDHGFDADRNTFVQAYGSSNIDAALLLIPSVGFLPGDDPRVVGTIEAVQRELQHDGFIRRYLTQDDATSVDGLSGEEATFLVCTFWLADALCLAGRTDEAREIYERILALRNDVGLLSEEYDVSARRLIGNVPQAYSHIGVVNTANNLSGASGPAHHRARGRSEKITAG
ncbi:MAG TPA: glycoside hydrolase family 15 protein [Acidothermaceae bacterium]|nr:glycoside hydrolase family 15 protein [Acidothermaceae bacterium]